jgi:hypothetical protein
MQLPENHHFDGFGPFKKYSKIVKNDNKPIKLTILAQITSSFI